MLFFTYIRNLKYFVLFSCATLTGCASMETASSGEQAANAALNLVSVVKSANPALKNIIGLQIQADKTLNTDAAKHAYSIVIRIYHLKQSSAFQHAFYDVFMDTQAEKASLGSDITEVREITLVPGQTYIDTEKIDPSTDYIGIVSLFQNPAADRWKLTFPTKNLYKTGIGLALHACSITVTAGTPLEVDSKNYKNLTLPTKCN